MSDHTLVDPHFRNPPQRHVLADRRDGVRQGIGHRAAARVGRSFERLDVAALVGRDRSDGAHERLEILVAGHEVGFRVDLDDDAGALANRDGHETLGRDTSRLLGRLRQTFLPKPIDRGLDVALRFVQRGFAVHHADAGLLAKILHHCGSDLSHVLVLARAPRDVAVGAK